MDRLNARTLLPQHVERPAYDRSALKPGIVHIGIGAFHRAHQAVYTDDALARDFGDWGIVGASLRSSEIVHALEAQDGLHSVTTRGEAGDTTRVVGAVIAAVAVADDRARLLSYLADPAIRIVTLTVSEKAYGLDPTTGGLDPAHPAVANDLARPDAPVGVIGFLTAGLALRQARGHAPFTVLSCDNLPGNGHVVRRLVIDMATRWDPALAAWIDAAGRFPSSMVDRIVPAATEETRDHAASALGVQDALALATEPFSQWVIEDRFVAGRPAWEAGGALFVDRVEPYEKMKLRLLNGSHSLIAYLGQINGLEHVRDVMAVPDHARLVRAHMRAALPTLDPVPGIDLDRYADQLVARFANPAIAHRTAQIAMDGTQKLPQRIFVPAAEALAAGSDADAFAFVTGLWIAFLLQAGTIDDPRSTELREAARLGAGRADPSAPFFDIPGLFPPVLAEAAAWRARVDGHVKASRA